MNWNEIEFEKLYAAPSKNGLTRPTRVRGSGHKMINMGELFANDRIGDIDMELVPINDKELSTMLVEPGDLLFARQSLVLAGAGKCSLVTKADEPTTFESHIIRVRLKREIADPAFFHYYFKSSICRIRSIVTQGVQAGIRGNDLKKLKVHVPPVSEQRHIASILSAYDDLIENNRRRIQLLEQAARLLYREWFVHLRFPGHEHATITDGVPEGWEKKPLFDIASPTYGFAFKSKLFNTDGEGIPVARIRNIPSGESQTYTTEEAPEEKLLEDGEFVIGMDGDFHMNFWTGGKTWINQRVVRIKGAEDVSDAFLRYACEKPIQDFNATIAGTTVAHLGAKHLKLIKVLIPPKGILYEAQDFFDSIQSQIVALSNQSRLAKKARDLLLPRLMDGEVTP